MYIRDYRQPCIHTTLSYDEIAVNVKGINKKNDVQHDIRIYKIYLPFLLISNSFKAVKLAIWDGNSLNSLSLIVNFFNEYKANSVYTSHHIKIKN